MGNLNTRPPKKPLQISQMDKMVIPQEITHHKKHYTFVKEYKDWVLYEDDLKRKEGFTKVSLVMKQLGLLRKGEEKYEGISRYSNL